MEKKQITFNITDGKTFFADEVSITNNPLRFILDFKISAPRIDPRVQQQGIPIHLEHNTVVVDTWLAKELHRMLGEHIKKYEGEFGEINEPEQIKKVREDQKHHISHVQDSKPGYFG